MKTVSELQPSGAALIDSVPPDHPIASLILRAFAVVSDPFRLYQHHVNGTSIEEIAEAFNLPLAWVEQRIEAVRLCVEHQLAFTFEP